MEDVEKMGRGVKHPILGVPKEGQTFKVPLRESDVHYLGENGKEI